MRAALVVLAIAWLAAASALAQDAACEEGRTRIDGRCCWPGQTFSAERLRCEGEPVCPEALVAHGESCVARVTVAALPAAPSESAAPPQVSSTTSVEDPVARWLGTPVPDTYGLSTTAWPTLGDPHPSRAVRVHGEDEGLITFALALFDFGFVLGWLTAGLDAQSGRCFHECNSWPLAFIPIGGGVASGFVRIDAASGFGGPVFGYILGIPSALLQIIGGIAAIIAFANSTTELGFRPIGDPDGVSLSFVLDAPGADAGASLALRF